MKRITKLKEKKKNNRGITLIALVITIIVLLILAAVSIATLTGENGILTKAQVAKEKTEVEDIIERIRVEIMEIQSENEGTITKQQLENILNKYGSITKEDNEEIFISKEGYPIKLPDIFNGFSLDTPNTIMAKDIAQAENKNEYYGAIVTGYTCPNKDAVKNWKILYADNNNIYLIADDYISYRYCPSSTSQTIDKNTDYKLFMEHVIIDYPDGSSHINSPKIQNLNHNCFEFLATNNMTSTNDNMKAVAYMLDTDLWKHYKGEKADYAVGAPTIELLINSYSQKYNVNYLAQQNDSIGYKISKDGGVSWSNKYSEMFDTDDSLYVIKSTDKTNAMWIASPSATDPARVMNVDYDGFVAGALYTDPHHGFRPLVCLSSEVRLEKKENNTFEIK